MRGPQLNQKRRTCDCGKHPNNLICPNVRPDKWTYGTKLCINCTKKPLSSKRVLLRAERRKATGQPMAGYLCAGCEENVYNQECERAKREGDPPPVKAHMSYVRREERRIHEMLLRSGWKECHAVGVHPPVGHFRQELHIDFRCAGVSDDKKYAKIDFVLGVEGGLVFLEVDEHQHKYGYRDHLSCDIKRMNSVMGSLIMEASALPVPSMPNVLWLRYNPNAWKPDGATRRLTKDVREGRLVKHLRQIRQRTLTEPLAVGYAFYDETVQGELKVIANKDPDTRIDGVVYNLKGLEGAEVLVNV